ncbi:RNA polymerase sigma factor [Streptosporangium pseudovulgare]|uniref:DNA-directed RNA polymerase sigma-70 factor n=1 Tax=Streptosporangium pseudovulgare TaxID=35765 RepID=A0ABQ2QJ97_9ACTN|nr:sigma-70 family RNA polymerase sigma factor [Streptosporangium pseudovulgare]GGP84249.1 DNA-directed RNA polymerase sigma-70 factor [Streptosporangium pseudovulgare]
MTVHDEADFTRMFHEHYESVLRYAWRRVGPDDAPDIAAETFRIAWEKYGRLPRDEPLPWLYVTARNLMSNLLRKEERRDGLTGLLLGDTGPRAGEEDHSVAVATRHTVLAALNRLSDGDRELVLLVCWEGLDLRQAAKIVGCSRPAATMRLHRARKRLQRLLTEDSRPVADPRPSYRRGTA